MRRPSIIAFSRVLSRRALHCLAVLVLFATVVSAHEVRGAAPEFNLFVAIEGSQRVLSVDPDLLQVVGGYDLGFVPRDVAISAPLKALVASDRTSPSLRIVNVVTGSGRTVVLPFIPTRTLLAPDGLRVAAVDGKKGGVVFVDLRSGAEIARADGLGAIGEAVFSGDSTRLYVTGHERGIRAIAADTGDARSVAGGEGDLAFAALARAPNGRDGFAKRRGEAALELIDFRKAQAVGTLAVSPSAGALYVSGTGRYLLLPDTEKSELSVASTETRRIVATLRGGKAMQAVYSAWFDMVAFGVSAGERKIFVYDLDRLENAGEVALGGTPVTGVVSSSGDKLFVPTANVNAIQVIDATQRRLAGAIPLPAPPIAVAMAGGYGVCH